MNLSPRLQLVRENLLVRAFAMTKIPLLSFCAPRIMELSDERAVIKIPCNRRTQNHLKSLYFGAFCVGADLAGGIIAMRLIQRRKLKVSLIFKDFQAEFLKRAEGDTHFTCLEGKAIQEALDKAVASGERQNVALHIVATVPSKSGAEPVARFTITLSLKQKG